MNFNNFTIKSQEAVQKAVNLVKDFGQQAVEPAHLMLGVLDVGENVTNFLLQKLGVTIPNPYVCFKGVITAAVWRGKAPPHKCFMPKPHHYQHWGEKWNKLSGGIIMQRKAFLFKTVNSQN